MSELRWDPGFLCSGEEFEPFWANLASDLDVQRRGLLIAGRGIDPRTMKGASALMGAGFPIDSCHLLHLIHPFDTLDRPRSREAAENEASMRALFGNAAFEIKEIEVLNENGMLVASTHIRALFANLDWLYGYTDVIVDISALPNSVSFPLLGALIEISDDEQGGASLTFNLHCIVCENAEVDELIISEGGDVADYISPFRGQSGLASVSDPITIWAPVLGKRATPTLRKIYEMLQPAEVRPFLPSPSRNPRRGDELVSEYHSLLFDDWEVAPRGFIYADERDPFDIYRQIRELAADYAESLTPLGMANTVVSAHSSKLLSLGILLAAFEKDLAIAHVEPTGYDVDAAAEDQEANELFEIWLTGEAYDAN